MGSQNGKVLNGENLSKIPEAKGIIEFICREHKEIMNEEKKGIITNGRQKIERPCFEHNRVVFSGETESKDQMNASYITGFERPKEFIATLTPDSEKMINNFWKMVWEQQSEIIVMLNEPDENEKGLLYWNLEERSTFYSGKLTIETLKSQRIHSSIEMTKLLVTCEDGGSLLLTHFLFKNWQRIDILPAEHDFLNLINMTRLYSQHATMPVSDQELKSPVIVHCSDGLQRSMVYCAINISISQILKTGKVNMLAIVSELRNERSNCLHHADHYCFCYSTFYHYFTNFM